MTWSPVSRSTTFPGKLAVSLLSRVRIYTQQWIICMIKSERALVAVNCLAPLLRISMASQIVWECGAVPTQNSGFIPFDKVVFLGPRGQWLLNCVAPWWMFSYLLWCILHQQPLSRPGVLSNVCQIVCPYHPYMTCHTRHRRHYKPHC